ncbi:uncharacterized protein LOC122034634 isoform X1 [Zingiber officinale]|uniref:Uncharacterized protein n=1 Tax=Zingiber officinale TaxID=94328 RepID=A0A8J5C1N3_ZINOF|nr:uncharacterized protein LOC122034634 isoform X1 [Zingiber officinale]KAG6469091.1 hypothetical protein ZIOFF_073789 [Zingiber officinale]
MAARNRPRAILNLPRLVRRSRAAATMNPLLDRKLVDLLEGRDRQAQTPRTPTVTPPGERGGDSGGDERWRFQAEMLRAECKFLRMEREIELRKLERNRAQMEDTLRSAMDTLVLGRKKIDCSESVEAALDASIEELEERLQVLRLGNGGCGRRNRGSSRGMHPMSSGRRNFDRQASVLRRRLEKMDDDLSVKDIQEISVPDSRKKAAQSERIEAAESSSHGSQFPDEMEMLQRKMDGLSRGMSERIEECSHFLSANDGSIITSNSQGERSDLQPIGCATAIKQERFLQIQKLPPPAAPDKLEEEKMGLLSCCNCKELVSHIMQQVRAESEQWTEMQEMLDQVRVEMEELKSSRDHWQRRAISSEVNFHSQQAHKLEWKQRARSSERKVIELQKVVKELQKELQPLKTKLLNAPPSSPTHSEFQLGDPLRIAQNQQTKSLNTCKEKEKHILVCHMNSQNHRSRRTPLRDINNISPRPRHRV